MYELIEHKRLIANAASVTFSNIPQFYTDLLLVGSARTSRSSGAFEDSVTIRPNGETSGITQKVFFGNGSSAASTDYVVDGALRFVGASSHSTANTFGSAYAYFPSYSSSQTKTISIDSISENNAAEGWQFTASTRWNNTAPITSITLDPLVGAEILPFSSFTLYGINRTSAFGKPKAIGGNITYANGYWVHTFTGSGSFIPSQDLQLDYVVIAGGGGGGHGGGGAGGYVTPSVPLLAKAQTAIPVIVGAGGANSFGITVSGSNGFDSYLGTVRAIGGGRGGSVNNTDSDLVGGSGGGSGGAGGSTNGSAGTAGQGFAGGNFSYPGSNQASAGGGGAGGPGAGNSGLSSGAGGPGIVSSITGTSVGRAGGGGGGQVSTNAPGSATDGGGAGSWSSTPGNNGTANTGGGGGGAGFDVAGGSGGSGVVIIRYPAAEIRSAELAQPGVQYKIDPLTIQGAWTFATSENATYGGHTTDDYGNVGTIQSSTRKWTQYAGALQTAKVDANNSGMRLSSATNWTMSNEETIEMWVNPISGGRLDRLFTWGNRQDNTCTFIGRNTSTGQLDVRTNTGTASTTGYVLDGQWSWVVMSKRGSELRVFVNGIQVYYNANGDGSGYTTDGRYFTLGADWDSGYTDAPRFSGAAYWQDVIAYNAAPFHSMSTIPVPTMPLTDRII